MKNVREQCPNGFETVCFSIFNIFSLGLILNALSPVHVGSSPVHCSDSRQYLVVSPTTAYPW